MPIPAALSIAGQVAGSLLGPALDFYQGEKNRNAQAKANQQNMAFAREMYDRQRTDALQDWERNNQYNSPVEQMNRLRQAGLNPNLIYGKGAENTAAMIRSSSAPSATAVAPHLDYKGAGDLVGKYLSVRQTQAQTDNLNEQNALLKKEQLLKDALTAKTLTENARGSFDLNQAKSLNDLVIKRAQLENQESMSRISESGSRISLNEANKAAIDVTNFVKLSQNEREELMNSQNLKLGIIKMLEMRKGMAKTDAEIAQLTKAQEIANQVLAKGEYEQALNRRGVQTSDNFIFRALGEIMNIAKHKVQHYRAKH